MRTDGHDVAIVAFRNFTNALKILRSAHTVYLYPLYGSQNSHFFPCTALIGWFKPRRCVHCAVRTGFLTQLGFIVLALPLLRRLVACL